MTDSQLVADTVGCNGNVMVDFECFRYVITDLIKQEFWKVSLEQKALRPPELIFVDYIV